MNIDNLIRILQASIAPVVLISGVGLLLLTMTNRLGRTIDRIRALCLQVDEKPERNSGGIREQVDILYQRCRYLRTSIVLAITCIMCVSTIIIVLFTMHIYQVNLIGLVEFLFEAGLLALSVSLVMFLMEVWAALASVKLEITSTFGTKK